MFFRQVFSVRCFPSSVFRQAFSVKCFPSSVFRQVFFVKRFPSSVFRQVFFVKCFPSIVFLRNVRHFQDGGVFRQQGNFFWGSCAVLSRAPSRVRRAGLSRLLVLFFFLFCFLFVLVVLVFVLRLLVLRRAGLSRRLATGGPGGLGTLDIQYSLI